MAGAVSLSDPLIHPIRSSCRAARGCVRGRSPRKGLRLLRSLGSCYPAQQIYLFPSLAKVGRLLAI